MGMCVMTFSDAGKSGTLRRFVCLDGSVVQTGKGRILPFGNLRPVRDAPLRIGMCKQ